jgi:hypothetical protein
MTLRFSALESEIEGFVLVDVPEKSDAIAVAFEIK